MDELDRRHPSDVPTQSVNDLLFTPKSGGDLRPFDNVPDLGRTIVALPTGSYPGKEETVIAFLRQVLNGSRPCPDDLRTAILEATRRRLRERKITSDHNSYLIAIEQGITTIQHNRGRRMREKYGFSPKLAEAFINSELRFAVNPPLGEVQMSLSQNKRISQLIAENLCLLEEDEQTQMTYIICYPEETDAIDLWCLLSDELTGKCSESGEGAIIDVDSAADRIQRADENGHLHVIAIPYYLCLASAVIYHIENPEKCTGAALQIDDSGRVTLHEIRERNIPYWRRMYNDLEKGEFGPYTRLRFKEYRQLVIRKSQLSKRSK